jgi:N4-gp56 family major capsid protein
MAKTNFNALTDEQLTVWSRTIWKQARNMAFVTKFSGSSPNSMIQRITELTKSDKGARAVITLVPDLEDDGVAGDDQLEGNEEAIKAYDQVIRIDQLRNANRHKGRLADQKSVVNFRQQSKDVLAYWLADRMDQLGFLTMSGISYALHTNGAARVGSALSNLEYAADLQAPSANRHFRWSKDLSDANGAGELLPGDTTEVEAKDKPTWAMLVEAKARAKELFIRGIKGPGGQEFYHVFMTPTGMAALRQDAGYLANVRNAGVRGSSNELFKGTDTVLVDGLFIHEYRHVFNTRGVASKWGEYGTVEGQRVIFAGAQALGMADIGSPYWVEKGFDYENQQGISVGKIFGLLKPQFRAVARSTLTPLVDEDHGLMVIDTAV